MRGNLGLDYINRIDTQICRFQNCPDVGTTRQGFKIDNRSNFFIYTLDARRDGDAPPRELDRVEDDGRRPGLPQLLRSQRRHRHDARAGRNDGHRRGDEGRPTKRRPRAARSAGIVEENVAFRDRLFLTGAVRSDKNSAFGADFKRVYYPKAALSWVISDEYFFPQPDFLNQLRLRTAYGASGVQPGTMDAAQFFSTHGRRGESGDFTGRRLQHARQPQPQAGALHRSSRSASTGRSGTTACRREVTYYNKSSKDALVSRVLPPSFGTGATVALREPRRSHEQGRGSARSTRASSRRGQFGWDITLNGSTNANKLVTLGGLPTIVSSSTQQQREGYPLNGWWSRGLVSFQDKNGDGIITNTGCGATPDPQHGCSEIVVTDTAIYLGNSQPKYEAVVHQRLRLAEPPRAPRPACSTTRAASRSTTTPSAFAARAASTAPV